MGRIDIVVFPNGGSEIFGQVNAASMTALSEHIDEFVASLPDSDSPRKFTGYYDEPNASDIGWGFYDKDNPIVLVPIPLEEIEPTGDPIIDQYPVKQAYRPMELAQAPAEMRELLDIQGY